MTSYQPGLAIGIAAHLVIAAAFVGIALVVTPRFRFFTRRLVAGAARGSAAVFVLSSAVLHVDLAYEAWRYGVADRADPRGVGTWFVQFHGLAVALAEAIAAVLFLALCVRLVSSIVVDQGAVQAALDERIRQIDDEIARREQARGES